MQTIHLAVDRLGREQVCICFGRQFYGRILAIPGIMMCARLGAM